MTYRQGYSEVIDGQYNNNKLKVISLVFWEKIEMYVRESYTCGNVSLIDLKTVFL